MPLNFYRDSDADVNILVEKLNEGILKLDMVSSTCACIILKCPRNDIESDIDALKKLISYLSDLTDKEVLCIPDYIDLKEFNTEELIVLRNYINEILVDKYMEG